MKSYKSIKAKIMVSLAPGLLVLFTLFGYFLFWAVEYGNQNHAEFVLVSNADNLENHFRLSHIKQLEDLKKVVDSLQINSIISDTKIAAIATKNFDQLFIFSNISEESILKNTPEFFHPDFIKINDETIEMPVQLFYYPLYYNWIILEHSINTTFYGSEVVRNIMFLLIPAIVLLIGILVYYSINKVLEPVSHAITTARSISTGSLQHRLRESGNEDEIDILIKTFNEMIERIDVGFKKLAQFTSNVAHELRTPITIIRGEMELALKSVHSAEEKEIFISILDEVSYLSKVIEKLLLFSRLENENIELERFEMGLKDILKKVAGRFRKLTADKQLKININANCYNSVFVDIALIEELFSILFDNAIKYSHPKTIINVTIACEEEYCHVVFSDTCDGIPEGDEKKIFDRFYQINQVKSDPKSGSGLGLAIAKRIVMLHNGRIYAENINGSGCAFHVLIPLALYD